MFCFGLRSISLRILPENPQSFRVALLQRLWLKLSRNYGLSLHIHTVRGG
jgi:hypothetical protein